MVDNKETDKCYNYHRRAFYAVKRAHGAGCKQNVNKDTSVDHAIPKLKLYP